MLSNLNGNIYEHTIKYLMTLSCDNFFIFILCLKIFLYWKCGSCEYAICYPFVGRLKKCIWILNALLRTHSVLNEDFHPNVLWKWFDNVETKTQLNPKRLFFCASSRAFVFIMCVINVPVLWIHFFFRMIIFK